MVFSVFKSIVFSRPIQPLLRKVSLIDKASLPRSSIFFNSQWNISQGRSLSNTKMVRSTEIESKADMEKAMNEIEELFGAAKDEMEYAEESHGSVYYQEDRSTAKKAVEECLNAYEVFLNGLPSDAMRQEVQGKVGMKLRELKMAFEALPEDDH